MRTGKGEIVRQDLIPPIDGGFLLEGNGTAASGAGTVFPQPWVGTGSSMRRLDDVVSVGFLLIAPSTWSPSVQDLVLAQRHNVTLACIAERSLHPRVIALQARDPLIATCLASPPASEHGTEPHREQERKHVHNPS